MYTRTVILLLTLTSFGSATETETATSALRSPKVTKRADRATLTGVIVYRDDGEDLIIEPVSPTSIPDTIRNRVRDAIERLTKTPAVPAKRSGSKSRERVDASAIQAAFNLRAGSPYTTVTAAPMVLPTQIIIEQSSIGATVADSIATSGVFDPDTIMIADIVSSTPDDVVSRPLDPIERGHAATSPPSTIASLESTAPATEERTDVANTVAPSAHTHADDASIQSTVFPVTGTVTHHVAKMKTFERTNASTTASPTTGAKAVTSNNSASLKEPVAPNRKRQDAAADSSASSAFVNSFSGTAALLFLQILWGY